MSTLAQIDTDETMGRLTHGQAKLARSQTIAGDSYNGFTLTAYRIPDNPADCRVVLDGPEGRIREFTYPTYKIWTLLAHWREHDEVNPVAGPYADIAAELRRIADDIEHLTGDHAPVQARVTFAVRKHEELRATVDAIGRALCDRTGEPYRTGSLWDYRAEAKRGPVDVWTYGYIDDPTEAAEVERLRAENAALTAKLHAATAAAVLTPDAGS